MSESQNTQQQKRYSILLIGDDCIDTYWYGLVTRLSPEAPVPIFEYKFCETKPGMASNVEKNFHALGCDVVKITGETSNKTRLIDIKTKHHVTRIDMDTISNPIQLSFIEKQLHLFDAVVISDYNKGAITIDLVKQIRDNFKGPVLIDSKKKNLNAFNGCIVKINETEYNECTSLPQHTDVIVTIGSKGAFYKDSIYPTKKVDVVDVCGAGDTFLAALAYQYLHTRSIEESIVFANKASCITVQKFGTYAPTLKEIMKEDYEA